MKKVNVSTKYMARFAGQWVAIDPKKEKIIAEAYFYVPQNAGLDPSPGNHRDQNDNMTSSPH